MKTLQQIEQHVRETCPRLRDDVVRDHSWRLWLVDWHQAQTARLIELSSDPDRAQNLLQWVNKGGTLAEQVEQFRVLLTSNHLITREVAASVSSDPGKMLAPATENKMLTPSEEDK